ncbi:hypothetical protein CEP88_15415 [Roseobacter denitrificans]|nr:hypothetical protein CEP88_15415 [Roseobacter denitrificans]SFG17670.1 hypothetical protein SAMN05443635_10937 [Roseobacter denitrificans OCh 114]
MGAMMYCRTKPSSRVLRLGLAGALMLGLAACGGGGATPAPKTLTPVSLEGAQRFATGPIGTACNIHNRRTASQARCGCVQAAANLTLTQAEQQRSARFFAEPELLQQVKLSDSPASERFWYAWAAFAQTAEVLCADT